MRAFPLTMLVLLLLSLRAGFAQTDVQLLFSWDKRRSANYENIYRVIAATNGYVIAVGETLGPNLGDTDGLFSVMEAENGRELYRKSFGGSGDQCFYGAAQHFDGTITLVGYTKPSAKAPGQGWLARVDIEGNLLMEKTFPAAGAGDAVLKDIAVNKDGVVLAAGRRNEQQPGAIWLVRLQNDEIRDFTVPGATSGTLEGLTAGPDGAFALVGSTAKDDRTHPADAWVMKVDADGRDLWGGPRYFGDRAWQEGRGIAATADGGYALAGASASQGAGGADMWLVKLNRNGDAEWEAYRGGEADDVAVAVIELSEGGYALFGQTWSNLPRARYSTLELAITDARGRTLDSNTYAIRQTRADGAETAQSITELYTGDIVIAGGSYPDKAGELPTGQVSAVSYKPIGAPPATSRGNRPEPAGLIELSSAIVFDANDNHLLESEERGYIALDVTNKSRETLHNVAGRILGHNGTAGLEVWENIRIGALRPGQTKKMIAPVRASRSLPAGAYQIQIAVAIDGVVAGEAVATLECNRPEPAELAADGQFDPAAPGPGETVNLNVRLVNAGGMPTPPLEAQLNVPPGVNFFGSEKIQVPALLPKEARELTFPFSYDQNFPAQAVDFRFSAAGAGLAPLVKTFRLDIGNQPPPLAGAEGYMAWVSHEPKKEAIYTNSREVNLKVVAISKRQLTKDRFSILINGKKLEGQKMDETELSPPGERNDQYYGNKIQLREGLNKIQVVYEGEESFASPEITFNYSSPDKPNLYVLTIGVPYDNLNYTVKDANDIAGAYLKLKNDKGRVFKEVNVYPILKKEDATTLNIKKAFVELENLRRIKNGDLVIVFISSHGKVTHDNQFILIPSDYEAGYESVTSINFEADVLNRLRKIPGNKLVFIDACHSGQVTLGSKSYGDAASSKFLNDLLHATAGMEIFASCGDHEYSYEDESWGNGAFTKAILEAFNNETVEVDGKMISADIYADNPETGRKERGADGVITIGELKEFLSQRVPYLVRTVKKEAQHPHNRSTDLLPENTGIYMVEKKGN